MFVNSWLVRNSLVFALSIFVASSKGKTTHSRAPIKGEREGRWLGLFNIIQFRNDPCNVTSSSIDPGTGASVTDVEQGICYTSAQCSEKGGHPKANCAAGYGVCCVFEDSCYGVVEERISYFRNPGWPNSDLDPNYCTYSIKVTDPDVCQVRLDFQTFVMSSPSMTNFPFGQCSGDRLAIFASQPRLGLSEGNLVCGDMTGQHIYIPADATKQEDIIRLFSMVGTTFAVGSDAATLITNYTWDIKIEQIDCFEGNGLQAPDGCLQYFTTPTGSLESFNFGDPNSPYPISLDYAICIKKAPGFCGISLNTRTPGDSFQLNTNSAFVELGLAEDCYGDPASINQIATSSDYLEILGAFSYNDTARVPSAQHCGVFDGVIDTFPGIVSYFSGPSIIRVRTDGSLKFTGGAGIVSNSAQASGVVASGIEQGFKLTYSLTSSCPAN